MPPLSKYGLFTSTVEAGISRVSLCYIVSWDQLIKREEHSDQISRCSHVQFGIFPLSQAHSTIKPQRKYQPAYFTFYSLKPLNHYVQTS